MITGQDTLDDQEIQGGISMDVPKSLRAPGHVLLADEMTKKRS